MIRSSLKRGLKKVLGIPNRPDTVQPNVEPVRTSAPTPAPAPAAVEGLDEVAEAVGFADTIENPVADEAPVEEAVIAQPAVEPAAAAEASVEASAEGAAEGAIDIEEVQEILDDMVRPALQSDGGDITLLKIENNDIYVKLVGSCSSCPSSIMTMKMGVEALLKEEFPSMRELIQIDAMVMPT